MKDLTVYKALLIEEKKTLEGELGNLGVRTDSENPNDWEPPLEPITNSADKNEVADHFEDFEQARSMELNLELRLNTVKRALEKIDEGSYGICDVCKKEIGDARLNANSAAGTCIEHAK